MNDEHYWRTARRVLTAKQLRVLELRERHGFSLRQIGWTCGISIRTVREQLDRAHQLISLHLEEEIT